MNNFNQLENIKDNWDNIVNNSLDNHIFLTWEWLSCWWKHFGNDRKMRSLIIEDKNQILAIAPFMCSKYRFPFMGKITKIEYIGSPDSDYNCLITTKGNKEYFRLFLDYLFDNYFDWDILELRDMPKESKSYNFLEKISKYNIKYNLESNVNNICPYIVLPESIDIFKNSLSRNMRRNMKRRLEKLKKDYKVEVITHDDFNSVKKAMNVFFKLHQMRWEKKGDKGAFDKKNFRHFHIDVAKLFDERGWLNLHFLTIDDEPISAIYSYNYNKKTYEYLTGFNPNYSQFGVGNLLRMSVIEKSILNEFNEYDLMRGDYSYKNEWCTNKRLNMELILIRKGIFSKIYKWAKDKNVITTLAKRLDISMTI